MLYRTVIERWGPEFGVLVQYGNALKDGEAYGEADEAYLQALSIRPDSADAHLQRGHLQKLCGNTVEAEQLYREANRLDPSLASAIAELETLAVSRMQGSFRGSEGSDGYGWSHIIPGQELSMPAAVAYKRIVNQHRWRRG
jgi:tetratricopeptide (TPR) repeat protein